MLLECFDLNGLSATPQPLGEQSACFFGVYSQRTFPHDRDSPSRVDEGRMHKEVPLLIPGELGVPELPSAPWQLKVAASGMAVPEAAVDKYHSVPSAQYDVWLSRQLLQQNRPMS